MAQGETYEQFVDKFEPKKTTDDCMTPPLVYDAVRDWAVREYGLDGARIMRPFWPGADYQAEDYSGDCVVIDNPPFSILAKIRKFYHERGVRYFLFAPNLTLFSAPSDGVSYIISDSAIVYANGANVLTSFVTNMDAAFIRTAPSLTAAIKAAVDATRKETAKTVPLYRYPDNAISAALLSCIACVDFSLSRDECSFTRSLDSQRKAGKGIFGGGYLISDAKAAELKAAELKAAELKAAREATVWELSDREREIISGL